MRALRSLSTLLLVSLSLFVLSVPRGMGQSLPPFTQTTILGSPSAPQDQVRVNESLTRIQIPFVANESRLDPRVSYYASTFAGTVFVTRDGKIVYTMQAADKRVPLGDRNKKRSGWTLTETLVGGTPRPRGGGPTETHVSLLIGNDPALWRTGVATYDSVALGEVWPGVDVRLRAYGGNTEKLFTVRPGARASRIRMQVAGARSLEVNTAGALVATTGFGEVTFTRPFAYQEHAGVRRPIDVAYDVRGDRYGFRLGVHDPTLPVVIDPILQATYLGPGGAAYALAIHPTSGDVYVAGVAGDALLGTAGGAQPAAPGLGDAFVARLNAGLTALKQATFLGGSAFDIAYALAIHPTSGDVYVTGFTESTDFPGTTHGAQAGYGGGDEDAFVARLNPSLTALSQSTYLGGINVDVGRAIAIHPTTGEVFVAGNTGSTDFPGTTGGAQAVYSGGRCSDAFVARLNPGLTVLNQATYLGEGSFCDYAFALAIHPMSGEVYIAGTPAFVFARLNPALTVLNHATFDGHEFFGSGALAVHPTSGDVYVAGLAGGSNFPGTSGGAQARPGGMSDAYVGRVNADLTVLKQATYLGGSDDERNTALAIHPASGDVYVAGTTEVNFGSGNFPGTSGGAQARFGGGNRDAFVARLNAGLTILDQATYLGGNEFDQAFALAIHPTSGEVYVAGSTRSTNFPGTQGGAEPVGSGSDAFVARLTPDLTAIPGGLAVVNDLVTLSPLVTSFNPAPVPGGPAGTFTIRATFRNTSGTSIGALFFKVTQLSGGNLLLNADGGAGGVGAKLTPNVGADNLLGPGESVTTSFIIGLQSRSSFSFFVDLWGDTLQ